MEIYCLSTSRILHVICVCVIANKRYIYIVSTCVHYNVSPPHNLQILIGFNVIKHLLRCNTLVCVSSLPAMAPTKHL